MYKGSKVFIDHNYALEILRKWREYTEAKQILKEKKIHFQMQFPARLWVFYKGETCVYNAAEQATKDMAKRGLQVTVIKPTENRLEWMKHLTWQASHMQGRDTQPRRQNQDLNKD